MPPPRAEERPIVVGPSELQADTYPPVPGVPPTGPRVRRGPSDVARRWGDRVGPNVVIEVIPGRLHSLDDVYQAGFGIGLHARVVECAVIPVPVLFELVEVEGRLGERGEHRSVAGGVVHDEGFPSSSPLQLVFLTATEP